MPALTPEQNELKQAALAATPGPWRADEATDELHAIRGPNGRIVADVGYSGSLDKDKENAEFISRANPAAILALLAQLEAVQEARPEPKLLCKSCLNSGIDILGNVCACGCEHAIAHAAAIGTPALQQPAQAVPDECPLCEDGKLVPNRSRWCDKCGVVVTTSADATENAELMKAHERAVVAMPGEPGQ